jgi:hypothetical protein
MSKALRSCLIWGLLLGVNFPATARQTPKTKGKPDLKITLRTYDYAELPAGLLSRALNLTEIIFGNAGVVVAPILCTQDKFPAACKQSPDPLNIALRIVPKPVPGADFGTVGYASGPYVTVNFSRVEKLADGSDVLLVRILGCVAAHELGHVLLGPDSHSAEGIMAADWTVQELELVRLRLPGFEPLQKQRVRAYVIAHQQKNPDVATGSVALNQR